MCNLFITAAVGLVLLALPVACSTKERAPCQKVAALSTNKETKQVMAVKIVNTRQWFYVDLSL